MKSIILISIILFCSCRKQNFHACTELIPLEDLSQKTDLFAPPYWMMVERGKQEATLGFSDNFLMSIDSLEDTKYQFLIDGQIGTIHYFQAPYEGYYPFAFGTPWLLSDIRLKGQIMQMELYIRDKPCTGEIVSSIFYLIPIQYKTHCTPEFGFKVDSLFTKNDLIR